MRREDAKGLSLTCRLGVTSFAASLLLPSLRLGSPEGLTRMFVRRGLSVLCVLSAAALVTSCGSSSHEGITSIGSRGLQNIEGGQPSVEGPSVEATLTPAWRDEGNRLLKAKAAIALTEKGRSALNVGAFAYQSQPIPITGPGTYTIRFGPLSSEFAALPPKGYATEPPPDAKFVALPTLGSADFIVEHGQHFLQMEITVTNFRSPYQSFSMWLY